MSTWVVRDGENGRSWYVVLTDGEVESRLRHAEAEIRGVLEDLGEGAMRDGLRGALGYVVEALRIVEAAP